MELQQRHFRNFEGWKGIFVEMERGANNFCGQEPPPWIVWDGLTWLCLKPVVRP